MLDKIKALGAKVLAIIPFPAGLAVGYLLRAPIGLLLDVVHALLKL